MEANFYLVHTYTGEFGDFVRRINKSGIRPAEMGSSGIAYRYIFYGLEDPMDFPKDGCPGQGLAAIRIPESAFKGLGGRKRDYVEGSGIVKRLVDFVKDDSLDVSSYKKIRIS